MLLFESNQNNQTETKSIFINNQKVHISLEPNRQKSQPNWHKLTKKTGTEPKIEYPRLNILVD